MTKASHLCLRSLALRIFSACTFAAAATVGASAQGESFPAKPITMIVPFTAGGAGDILARMLSQKLEQTWGSGFVVENRVGAGGVVGAAAMQKAPSNGYTLMIAPSATTRQPMMTPQKRLPATRLFWPTTCTMIQPSFVR